jgi:hypothetical protein
LRLGLSARLAWEPVIWAIGAPPHGCEFALSGYAPRHPLESKLAALRKRYPDRTFWAREDGRLVEQLAIGAEGWSETPAPPSANAAIRELLPVDREEWRRLARNIACRQIRRCVAFAARSSRLEWFRRDLTVRFGSIVRTTGPNLPLDPRDRAPACLLAADRMLSWRTLPRPDAVVHLDGDPRRKRFRLARIAPPAPPGATMPDDFSAFARCGGWRCEARPRAIAYAEYAGGSIEFWRIGAEWTPAPAPVAELGAWGGADETEAFRRRVGVRQAFIGGAGA